MNSKGNIIIGAGLSGAIIARKIAEELDEKVLVIDRREHIAGNIYDYKDEQTGITVQKYGPHIFHTNNENVWNYLSRFTDWNSFVFKPKVVIGGKPVTLPFNLTTLYEVFEKQAAEKTESKLINKYGLNKKIPILELKKTDDEDLKFLADFVYKNVFEGYTIKQWGLKPEEIDQSITARVPVFLSHDNRYFQDKYQGIPSEGYTKMTEKILSHPHITVQLNTDWNQINKTFDRIIYTGSIDEFFNYKYGTLPYRSLKFDIETKDMEYYQPAAMVNHPNDNDFTRITEHKYFLDEKSPKTVISKEYSESFSVGKNDRYYPIANNANQELYEKYTNIASEIPNLYFLGRLGDYKYYNMDQTAERALKFFEEKIK